MKKDLLPALRKELENSFGRKILSSRDCLQLVDDIYQKTGYTVNANTLRRFFGLVKTNYSPSPSTITILAKYCGFNSIDEIENISTVAHEAEHINKEEILHYVISLFKSLTVKDGHHAIVESLVQQTVIFLERNPTLIDKFQREIAKTESGQYYYYELSVHMDRLNTYYGDGLRHYLRGKNTDEAKVFAHSLQVFRYWLTEDLAQMEKHMAALADISVNQHYPSHILGRLIAARIYFANAHQQSVEKILIDATKYHVAIMSGRGNAAPFFPDFELALCEALILTDQQEEGIEYIRRGKSFLNSLKTGPQTNPFMLWENLVNTRKDTGIKRFDQLNKKPQPVVTYNYHLNKRYNNLLVLALDKNNRKHNGHVKDLVGETGFSRFQHLSRQRK